MNDPDFAQFWTLYPRKVARAHALKMWRRLNAEEKFAALQSIPVHVRFWQIAGTSIDKIPHAGTWLNPVDGRRWEDELQMPAKKSADDWWRSTAGIEAKAREMGMWPPRAGEDWHSLKARLLAKAA
jgi:hypothetical protein